MKRIPELDGIRGVAILAVIVFHYWMRFMPGGWLGVDVFLVLSGFLITTLLLTERERTGTICLTAFYKRRALRLLPALTAFLIAYCLWSLWDGKEVAATLQSAAIVQLYAVNIAPLLDWSFDSHFLGHLWTLSLEEHFYLLWPLLLLALFRLTAAPRRILLFLAIAIAAVTIWRVFLYLQTGSFNRVYTATDTRMDTLLIGCAAAFVAQTRFRVPIAAASTAVACLAFHLFRDNPATLAGTATFSTVALSVAVLLLWLRQNPEAWPIRLLRFRPLVWVGELSYSLYLWHGLPLLVFRQYLGSEWQPVYGVAALALAFGYACASYYLIEKPFLRFKDRKQMQRKAQPRLVPQA